MGPDVRWVGTESGYGRETEWSVLPASEQDPERITALSQHDIHFLPPGDLMDQDLDHQETRQVVDLIIDRTKDLHDRGISKEVLTVDNHADGPYLYLRMKNERNPRQDDVLQLLKMNEGNSSGRGIGCISWDGSVHADQFWRHHSFGNILEKSFSRIWPDVSDPLMARLKDKKKYIKGRCATCRWLDICGGNFRVRAEAATGDLWAPDPACYLTDEEISI